LRSTSAPLKEGRGSSPKSSSHAYQRQAEQSKQLTARVSISGREIGGFQEQKETQVISRVKIVENKTGLDRKQQVDDTNTRKDVGMGVCGYKHCNCVVNEEKKSGASKAEIIALKITPLSFLAENGYLLKGGNEVANWEQGNTWSLQPMRLSEPGASIINMPSLLQGQTLAGKRQQSTSSQPVCHPSLTSPAVPPLPGDCCSCCFHGQARPRSTSMGTEWRRGAHSTTMYTRYRSPEYALMHADLNSTSSSTTNSESSIWATSNYRNFQKMRNLRYYS
jgi:hypothetical protein